MDDGLKNKNDSEVFKERSKRVKKGGSNRLFQKSISEGIYTPFKNGETFTCLIPKQSLEPKIKKI